LDNENYFKGTTKAWKVQKKLFQRRQKPPMVENLQGKAMQEMGLELSLEG
jgi:hypothetical protein